MLKRSLGDDDDFVTVTLNGKEYVINRILYNNKNYIELRSLEQAGFKVDYINSTPILDSPKE